MGADETVAELTRLLVELRDGRREALDEAVACVYGHLRHIAAAQLRRERAGHTLHPTALVHEAYLKLADRSHLVLENRAHFMAVAARAMRHILVDYARQRGAGKRGGDLVRTTLDGKDVRATDANTDILALDAALEQLGAIDPRARAIVEQRFFLGLSEEEIAGLMEISARTVRREWVKARAWLHATVRAGVPS